MKFNKTLLSSVAAIAVATSFSACTCEETDVDTTPGDPTYTVDCSAGLCTVSGTITDSLYFSNENVYAIDGTVKLASGTTLKIQEGTTLYGNTSSSYMVALKGAKIEAEGTASEPIIFTSKTAYEGGTEAAGQWGGLTLLGYAPTNQTDPYYEVDESDADYAFGGSNSTDNSGILKYVQIRNSGAVVGTDVEINGLSLCALGNGTTIDNITIVNSVDDGIEIWGGTVNLSNVTITNAQDDSLDLDYGYVGTVDTVTITQTEAVHAGMEISSGGSSPMTGATIKNFSITTYDGSDESGIYIKDDTTAPIFINGNVTVAGTNAKLAVYVKKALTSAQEAQLSFSNCTFTYGGNTMTTATPSSANSSFVSGDGATTFISAFSNSTIIN